MWTGKSQNALLFSTKLDLKGSAYVQKGSIAHFYLLLAPLPKLGIKNNIGRYLIFCLKPCRHRNHNHITFLFQNYHPNSFPIATSTSILNHKHLHLNGNSTASQNTLQKSLNEKQNPQEKERASGRLSSKILYSCPVSCFLPWWGCIPSCGSLSWPGTPGSACAGTPLWNRESCNK